MHPAPQKHHNCFKLRPPSLALISACPLTPHSHCPDNQQWTLATVPCWLKSNVFKTLRGKRLALQQWTDPSGIATGRLGKRTVGCIKIPLAKSKGHTSSRTDSSPLLLPCGKASTVTSIKSRFSQLLERSNLSPKNLFWTDIPTHNAPRLPSTSLISSLPAC